MGNVSSRGSKSLPDLRRNQLISGDIIEGYKASKPENKNKKNSERRKGSCFKKRKNKQNRVSHSGESYYQASVHYSPGCFFSRSPEVSNDINGCFEKIKSAVTRQKRYSETARENRREKDRVDWDNQSLQASMTALRVYVNSNDSMDFDLVIKIRDYFSDQENIRLLPPGFQMASTTSANYYSINSTNRAL